MYDVTSLYCKTVGEGKGNFSTRVPEGGYLRGMRRMVVNGYLPSAYAHRLCSSSIGDLSD